MKIVWVMVASISSAKTNICLDSAITAKFTGMLGFVFDM